MDTIVGFRSDTETLTRLVALTDLDSPSIEPDSGYQPILGSDQYQLVAERLVAGCSEVITGLRSAESMQLVAVQQVVTGLARLRERLAGEAVAGLRLSRASPFGRDVIEIVATLRLGAMVRAMALCARRTGGQWRLIECGVVGGY